MSGQKFAVAFQGLSKRIYVGRLNKANTLFLDKEDQTDRAVREVAEYVLSEYGGRLVIDFKDGVTYRISVDRSSGVDQ